MRTDLTPIAIFRKISLDSKAYNRTINSNVQKSNLELTKRGFDVDYY